MSKFYKFRFLCKIIGILSSLVALIGILLANSVHSSVGYIFLVIGITVFTIDIILIALKNRCTFCHKALRIAPIKDGEYCPYCGCKIE